MQDIIDIWSVVMGPTLWHDCDGEGGEMMPSLVVRDGVNAPHDEILLKRTLAFIAIGCIDMAPPSNSYDSMCMVILGATKPVTC